MQTRPPSISRAKEPAWLARDLVLAVYDEFLSLYGGGAGVRDEELLDSALRKPLKLFPLRKGESGPISMMHTVGGLKIGTLICNDLRVTPGYTDGPNPHYSLQLAKAGAQIIFHAVGSGNDQRYPDPPIHPTRRCAVEPH